MNYLIYVAAFGFPLFVIVIALYYLIGKPKIDNKYLGYRSERSVLNEAAWKRAQFIFGRQLLIGGVAAVFFGYGLLSVSGLVLKVILFIMEFFSVAFFGMFTEFILSREFGR